MATRKGFGGRRQNASRIFFETKTDGGDALIESGPAVLSDFVARGQGLYRVFQSLFRERKTIPVTSRVVCFLVDEYLFVSEESDQWLLGCSEMEDF